MGVATYSVLGKELMRLFWILIIIVAESENVSHLPLKLASDARYGSNTHIFYSSKYFEPPPAALSSLRTKPLMMSSLSSFCRQQDTKLGTTYRIDTR